MVKLSELRNRKGSDMGLKVDTSTSASASTVKSPSTWSAGSPSTSSPRSLPDAPSQLPPTPKSALRTRRQSFTERHGGKTLTRKFSKQISFDESVPDEKSPDNSTSQPLSPQPPSPPLSPLSPQLSLNSPSIPDSLKGVFTPAQIATFRKLFDYYDKDASGGIDKQELGAVLKEMGETPTVERVNSLMLEVDFDGNGVIDFEEFLHVMNSKRGGNSSFSSLVEKVERRLNPFLPGDSVSLMYKGEKVSGTLSKKQGPFWVINLDNGTMASGVASSTLSRPLSYKARIPRSDELGDQSPRSPPISVPAPLPKIVPPSPKNKPCITAPPKQASIGKMTISEMFKQVGEPDSPSSSLSSHSSYSLHSLPVKADAEPKTSPKNKTDSKAQAQLASKPLSAKKVPMKTATKSPMKADKSERQAESKSEPPKTEANLSPPQAMVETQHASTESESKSEIPKALSKVSPPPRSVVVPNEDVEEDLPRPSAVVLPKELEAVFTMEHAVTLRNLFDFYEKENTIKKSEFRSVLGQLGFGEPFLSQEMLNEILNKVDRGDGRIQFEAFLHGIALTKATQESQKKPKRSRPKKLDMTAIGKRMSKGNEDHVDNSNEDDEEDKESSDEEDGERRRTWFLKESMTPRAEVWQGSPRSKSPRSSTTPGSFSQPNKSVSPKVGSPRQSTVQESSVPNIDGVLASLFPGAKIQQSSNGIVMITPQMSPIQPIGGGEQETPQSDERRPSRLSEIIGRYSLSPINKNGNMASTPLSRESMGDDSMRESDHRDHALRGKDLIGNILSSQKAKKHEQPPIPLHAPSAASSRETPSSVDDSATPRITPRSPPTNEIISGAANRLEWVARTGSPNKDLNNSFAAEMSTVKNNQTATSLRSPSSKQPSSSLTMAPSKLVSAGGTLSSFSMSLYDVMGCVISAVGRVVHLVENGQAIRGGVSCGDFVIGIGKYKVNSIDSISKALEKCRRRAEYKVIQREIARRKESGSLGEFSREDAIELANQHEIDKEETVLVILMTPGNSPKPATGDKSYYAVL